MMEESKEAVIEEYMLAWNDYSKFHDAIGEQFAEDPITLCLFSHVYQLAHNYFKALSDLKAHGLTPAVAMKEYQKKTEGGT